MSSIFSKIGSIFGSKPEPVNPDHPEYDLVNVAPPRLAGAGLVMAVNLLETRGTRGMLQNQILTKAGLTNFRQQYPSCRIAVQPMFLNNANRDEVQPPVDLKELEGIYNAANGRDGFKHHTAIDYHNAFKAGTITPVDVVNRLIDAVAHSDQGGQGVPALRAFIAQDAADMKQQAEASKARYAAGKPLSVLDGVPIAIKDEFDLAGYETTVGTKFIKIQATEDCSAAARLRSAGAVLIGKANMHEIGLGVTGNNVHHGCTRNPYNPNHHTGGSSSGSAVSVAAGFCPIALGADGGGSIRIPAGLCGVVGLKPTWGRISEHGAFPQTHTVGHVGPLAATAADAAAAYLAMAGRDELDDTSLNQPRPHIDTFEQTKDLSDVTIGVYWPWFRDAHPDIVRTCEDTLEQFKSLGAKVVEVTIPNLELIRVGHAVIILSEMAGMLDGAYAEHRADFGHETRASLALGRAMNNVDLIKAMQARRLALDTLQGIFKKCTVLVTPATGCAAPEVAQDSLAYGASDVGITSMIMKFAQLANITGYPGISFPAGYTPAGLPVGLQFMGNSWEEHTLLRLANTAEKLVARQRPAVYYDLLHNKNTAADSADAMSDEGDVQEEVPQAETR